MNFVKTYASVTDAGFITLGVFYDLYMLKRDYFVAIVGTAQWSLKLASWLIDVNYILVPDNNCDKKFKGTDHVVFIPPCSNMPQTTVAHPSGRDKDDRWRLKIQSTDNTCRLMTLLSVNTGYGMFQNNFKNTHTYTAMYCFPPTWRRP